MGTAPALPVIARPLLARSLSPATTGRVVLLFLAISVCGCSGIQYYSQSVVGQFEILRLRRPVEEVIRNPATPVQMRTALEVIGTIRRFAHEQMFLPDNGSYRTYVALNRPYVVWNVFAAPELSLEPVRWCFPVVGCLNYRGYFEERQARRFAEGLERRGYDVHVGGASAYSTLGWFRDPVLDTMLRRDPAHLAKIILHELAHQKLYLKGDPEFNEAFADAVSLIGVERWLAGRPPAEAAKFRDDQAQENEFLFLVLAAKKELESVYNSELGAQAKCSFKIALAANLRERYKPLKLKWGANSLFDSWFAGEINNAKLVALSTYHELVPGFLRVFKAADNNLELFYASIDKLRECDPSARRRWLEHAHIAQDCEEASD